MANTEGYTHSAAGPMLQVVCWRSVCAFCMLLCVVVLPELGDAAKARCGAELIADLEFVCGDRGFYRGPVGGVRYGGSRSRGKGIVEQCCIKGCDLQHLEKYCAKPKRRRRQTPTKLQQIREDQFQRLFLKHYHRLQSDQYEATQKLKEWELYQEEKRNTLLPRSNEEIYHSVYSKLQHAQRVTPLRTFTSHSLHS